MKIEKRRFIVGVSGLAASWGVKREADSAAVLSTGGISAAHVWHKIMGMAPGRAMIGKLNRVLASSPIIVFLSPGNRSPYKREGSSRAQARRQVEPRLGHSSRNPGEMALLTIRHVRNVFYPILAAFGVPANLLTMVVLFRGNCGLSKCISFYMVGMATADLLVMIFCVIGYHIVMYQFPVSFLSYTSACKVVLYFMSSSLQTSVWYTVLFTFDRFVAICFQKFKAMYCTVRTAVAGIITVLLLVHLQSAPYLFEYKPARVTDGVHWGCQPNAWFVSSPVGVAWSFLQSILTVIVPFFLISLFNCLTVRRILVASKVRRELRGHSSQTQKDPEMEARRKSIILLFSVSGSFILLWLTVAVSFLTTRLAGTAHYDGNYTDPAYVATEAGYMLMYLSSCTNTCIYAATQTKFREELATVLKSPWTFALILLKRS
ncbi:probable G-protein coupled receptor 139 [Pristis pectinata]|uniref:probable G-protein coupled receptor 139 n=1 Tax=Pristis pectinata TaxID=685728 RepID=UPI00223D4CDE|nr:probable G-protein coupled receptor 139 [Pristis pectinata]